MKLRYNIKNRRTYLRCYDVNCFNILYYKLHSVFFPSGKYKDKFWGLNFWELKIENNPSGIKIKYLDYETDV